LQLPLEALAQRFPEQPGGSDAKAAIA